MNRRRFLAAAALAGAPLAALEIAARGDARDAALPRRPLELPPDGVVRVAVAIGPGVNVIDMSGPWEVFQDAADYRGPGHFELFTVAASTAPVRASGGLAITPAHSYREAPQPRVVVIPAHNASAATQSWLRAVARHADLLMSVCTGALVLAETGLLDGRTATTHHGSYDDFARTFPRAELVRGRRFVEHEHVATAGGLTSGIDLALRVVERYLGPAAAAKTAGYMEYSRRRVVVAS